MAKAFFALIFVLTLVRYSDDLAALVPDQYKPQRETLVEAPSNHLENPSPQARREYYDDRPGGKSDTEMQRESMQQQATTQEYFRKQQERREAEAKVSQMNQERVLSPGEFEAMRANNAAMWNEAKSR